MLWTCTSWEGGVGGPRTYTDKVELMVLYHFFA